MLCPICQEEHHPGRGLSWDGFGVNDCSAGRRRLATFSRADVDSVARVLGPKFAAAPELLEAVESLLRVIVELHPKMNVKKDFHQMVQVEAARVAVRHALGWD